MVIAFEAEPRKADRPSRLVPRPRGAPPEGRTARERNPEVIREERETKAADAAWYARRDE